MVAGWDYLCSSSVLEGKKDQHLHAAEGVSDVTILAMNTLEYAHWSICGK